MAILICAKLSIVHIGHNAILYTHNIPYKTTCTNYKLTNTRRFIYV